MPKNHALYMKMALKEAENALKDGEFPVGCIIVAEGRVVAVGARQNTTGIRASEVHHAEMIALEKFSKIEAFSKTPDITLYVTLEPCLMCYGAILLSDVREIVYAYEDVMGGGTGCDLTRLSPLYRSRPVTLISNVLREGSVSLLKTYFKNPSNAYWRGSLLAEYTLSQ